MFCPSCGSEYRGGEGIQELFGAGRMGGFNVLTGPVEVRVDTRWQRAAEEALRELADLPPPLANRRDADNDL